MISRLETDVQEAKYACIAETDKFKQVQDKLPLLESETLKLKKEIVEAQSEFVERPLLVLNHLLRIFGHANQFSVSACAYT